MGSVAIVPGDFSWICHAIAIVINKPVGLAVPHCTQSLYQRNLLCIGLNCLVQLGPETIYFIVETFSYVAVAVIVFQGALHTDVLQGCLVRGAGMAGYALVILELKRMRVMTGDAGVIAFHVGKLGIIDLAVITGKPPFAWLPYRVAAAAK